MNKDQKAGLPTPTQESVSPGSIKWKMTLLRWMAPIRRDVVTDTFCTLCCIGFLIRVVYEGSKYVHHFAPDRMLTFYTSLFVAELGCLVYFFAHTIKSFRVLSTTKREAASRERAMAEAAKSWSSVNEAESK